MQENSRKIMSIDKAMVLLLCLAKAGHPLSLGEICGIMGLPKSSVHDTLSTMRYRRMIEQSEKTGKYWLGSMVTDLWKATDIYEKEVQVKEKEEQR